MSDHDLYQELLQLAKQNNTRISIADSVRSVKQQKLDDFKSKVKDVKSILSIINKNNNKILTLRDTLAHNASAKKEQQTNKQIMDTIQQNSQLIVSVRALLSIIDKLIQVEKKERQNEPETMSKIYQKKYLLDQVTKIMKQSSKIEVLYKKWTVADAVRNIQLFDSSVSQEQATRIAKSTNGYQNFLKQKQLGSVSLKMKYRIEDIIEKNHAIKKLQKSIFQNLQMMKQIAVMVKEQGQMLDCIEQNMMQAHDYVEKASKNLKDEVKIHKKNRRKICCIIVVGLALLAVVMVPIIVKLVKKK